MYAMAMVMKVVLGWNIHFSIWVSSLTVAVYVALGGLYSAIFNEVLQFFLIWLGALIIPILGLIEVGGWSGLQAQNLRASAHQRLRASVEHAGHFLRQSHGRALDRHCLRARRRHCLRLLDHRFSGGAARHGREGSAFGATGADHCFLFQNGCAADRDSSRACWGSRCCPTNWCRRARMQPGLHSYNEVLPLMLARYAGPGLLGLGITALIAGFMSGMAGNVSAFATVWTYDIYQPYIKKGMSDAHYVRDRPLVHDSRRLSQHRDRILCHQLQKHHGLHAGAGGLFYLAAVRLGDCWACCGSARRRKADSGGCLQEQVLPLRCTPRSRSILRGSAMLRSRRMPKTWPRISIALSGRC